MSMQRVWSSFPISYNYSLTVHALILTTFLGCDNRLPFNACFHIQNTVRRPVTSAMLTRKFLPTADCLPFTLLLLLRQAFRFLIFQFQTSCGRCQGPAGTREVACQGPMQERASENSRIYIKSINFTWAFLCNLGHVSRTVRAQNSECLARGSNAQRKERGRLNEFST